jgi:transcription elongation factor Elf1
MKIGEAKKTVCPRCGKEAEVKKTEYVYILRCDYCGFDMGTPWNKEMEEALEVD